MTERRLQTAVLVVYQQSLINSADLYELDLIRISKIGFVDCQKQTAVASTVDMHMSMIIIIRIALQRQNVVTTHFVKITLQPRLSM